ncbi:hypothetical protein ACS0TY_016040 [Phlomoides rotata]
MHIRWQCPAPSFMKANVDGGASGAPGLLTGGGGFRNNFGVFQGAFSLQLGSGYAFEVELVTALHAICMGADRGWTQHWMECDSMYVVQCFRCTTPSIPWRLLPLWHRAQLNSQMVAYYPGVPQAFSRRRSYF